MAEPSNAKSPTYTHRQNGLKQYKFRAHARYVTNDHAKHEPGAYVIGLLVLLPSVKYVFM